ncbi:MAG TPA: hypothetical protein VJS65_15440 [Verrucomicrobiae bacterium]|nr:hypothetical protein [Verrucomicrobiae bacterium]
MIASAGADTPATPPPESASAAPPSQVVIVHDPQATSAFKPRQDVIRRMVTTGITNLARTGSASAAWKKWITTNDTVGIKVHSTPGPDTGTRPAVVAAVVEQLLQAGLPPSKIIIWDRQRADLRQAGFFNLASNYGVRVEGSVNAGFDPGTFYNPDRPVIGPLIWSDLEFGKKTDAAGRKSFVSKLVAREITKIVVITPVLNHNTAGVFGHLFSLALGSVDNTLRFENDLLNLKTAVPEIYALPSLSDRVVLCMTDALVCQYEGEQRGLLHYSAAINEIRFSQDPVALDLLSLRELERQRVLSAQPLSHHNSFASQMELLENAALLELGSTEDTRIRVQHVPR